LFEPLLISITDSSDSVSRELVEAGLVDGKDMIVGELLVQQSLVEQSLHERHRILGQDL